MVALKKNARLRRARSCFQVKTPKGQRVEFASSDCVALKGRPLLTSGDFVKGEIIGRGANGTVYKGLNTAASLRSNESIE